jgi:NAD(P)-dependent dehydrogenase (short-subunit alcohol dehydrogenase family)
MSGPTEVRRQALNCSCIVHLLTPHFSTPLLQDWLGDDAAKRHRREIHFPTGRFGEAIEQAQAVLFLASDESSFVNGTDFVVDGGMTKVYFTLLFAK